jgi:hypothetical protein
VFNDWAWRIPFLFSFLLVFVTMYMRANFEESPVYAEIKAKGQTSKNPWREAFLDPVNLRYVVIATIVVLGEGVVWYSTHTKGSLTMDEYESLSHSKWECKYHVVFIPKCRRRS